MSDQAKTELDAAELMAEALRGFMNDYEIPISTGDFLVGVLEGAGYRIEKQATDSAGH